MPMTDPKKVTLPPPPPLTNQNVKFSNFETKKKKKCPLTPAYSATG